MDEFERAFELRKETICPVCGGHLVNLGSGVYQCQACGAKRIDDFGKVKAYIEEHGPSTAFVISADTGVPVRVIQQYLKNGRLEIPEGSDDYIRCEKCGCKLRYGRYCASCAKELVGKVEKAFLADIGEKPKEAQKMHFLNKKDKSGR